MTNIWNVERLNNGWHIWSEDGLYDHRYRDGQVVTVGHDTTTISDSDLGAEGIVELTEKLIEERIISQIDKRKSSPNADNAK